MPEPQPETAVDPSPDTELGGQSEQDTPTGGSGRRAGELLRTVLSALALAAAIRVGIAQAYQVDGPSMEPTLLTGERLFVLRCAYGLSLPTVRDLIVRWAMPDIGDVVIVESPREEGEDLVKRVLGLPGDLIEVRDDRILRNGEALPVDGPAPCDASRFVHQYPACETYEEAAAGRRWQISQTYIGWNQTLKPVRVPEGHIYIVGDHRTRSNDSRAFGPVPASLLRGRVLFVD